MCCLGCCAMGCKGRQEAYRVQEAAQGGGWWHQDTGGHPGSKDQPRGQPHTGALPLSQAPSPRLVATAPGKHLTSAVVGKGRWGAPPGAPTSGVSTAGLSSLWAPVACGWCRLPLTPWLPGSLRPAAWPGLESESWARGVGTCVTCWPTGGAGSGVEPGGGDAVVGAVTAAGSSQWPLCPPTTPEC